MDGVSGRQNTDNLSSFLFFFNGLSCRAGPFASAQARHEKYRAVPCRPNNGPSTIRPAQARNYRAGLGRANGLGLFLPALVKTNNVATSYFQTQQKLSPKQVRWQDFLAEFDFTLEYKPELLMRWRMPLADELSWHPYVNLNPTCYSGFENVWIMILKLSL